MTKLRLAFAFVSVACVMASCEDVRSYVYSAQSYDATNACLNDYTAVEIVEGSGANAYCAPTCFTVGSTVYVSTQCPPLPAVATELPADASPCSEALDAELQEASCANAGGGDDQGDDGGGDDEGGDDGGGDDGGGDDGGGGDGPDDAAEAG